MKRRQPSPPVDAEGAGPPPGPPAVCLLHLNFEPCPWCEPVSRKMPSGEVEAATIDTSPRRRKP